MSQKSDSVRNTKNIASRRPLGEQYPLSVQPPIGMASISAVSWA